MTSTVPQCMLGRSQAFPSSPQQWYQEFSVFLRCVCVSVMDKHVCVQSGVLADMSFIHQTKLVTVLENVHLPDLSFTDQHYSHTIHHTHTSRAKGPHNLSSHTPIGSWSTPSTWKYQKQWELKQLCSLQTTKLPGLTENVWVVGERTSDVTTKPLQSHDQLSSPGILLINPAFVNTCYTQTHLEIRMRNKQCN